MPASLLSTCVSAISRVASSESTSSSAWWRLWLVDSVLASRDMLVGLDLAEFSATVRARYQSNSTGWWWRSHHSNIAAHLLHLADLSVVFHGGNELLVLLSPLRSLLLDSIHLRFLFLSDRLVEHLDFLRFGVHLAVLLVLTDSVLCKVTAALCTRYGVGWPSAIAIVLVVVGVIASFKALAATTADGFAIDRVRASHGSSSHASRSCFCEARLGWIGVATGAATAAHSATHARASSVAWLRSSIVFGRGFGSIQFVHRSFLGQTGLPLYRPSCGAAVGRSRRYGHSSYKDKATLCRIGRKPIVSHAYLLVGVHDVLVRNLASLLQELNELVLPRLATLEASGMASSGSWAASLARCPTFACSS